MWHPIFLPPSLLFDSFALLLVCQFVVLAGYQTLMLLMLAHVNFGGITVGRAHIVQLSHFSVFSPAKLPI